MTRVNKKMFDALNKLGAGDKSNATTYVVHGKDIAAMFWLLALLIFTIYLVFVAITWVSTSKAEIKEFEQRCSIIAGDNKYFVARNNSGNGMYCNVVQKLDKQNNNNITLREKL